jgi:hypothetical protein
MLNSKPLRKTRKKLLTKIIDQKSVESEGLSTSMTVWQKLNGLVRKMQFS